MAVEQLAVGVIGTGRFGANHVRTLAENPRCKLTALADIELARAETLAVRYNVPHVFRDYQDLLALDALDAVVIATPAHLHAAPAIDAAEHKKHILVEKPIATRLTDADAMIAAAKRNHVCFMVGQLLRFEIHLASMYAAVREGAFGEPLALTARMNNPIAEARYAAASVSIVEHIQIHLIDLALWLMGTQPRRVYAVNAVGHVQNELGAPDGCVTTIEFEGSRLATLSTFWCLPDAFAGWSEPNIWNPLRSDIAVHLLCTDGVLEMDPLPALRAVNGQGWKFPQLTLRPQVLEHVDGALQRELTHWIDCCLAAKKPLIDGPAGYAALRVALAVLESIRSGSSVELERFDRGGHSQSNNTVEGAIEI